MANEFCDWEPCGLLQEFIQKYALPHKEPATMQAVVYRKGSNPHREAMKVLTFYYCPFCGTRLHGNIEILKWISRQGL